MVTKRQKQRIKVLAKLCVKAYKAHPDCWLDPNEGPVFDFPDYGGLPKRTANSLSSDVVDVIQGFILDVSCGSQTFTQRALERTLNEYARRGYAIRE